MEEITGPPSSFSPLLPLVCHSYLRFGALAISQCAGVQHETSRRVRLQHGWSMTNIDFNIISGIHDLAAAAICKETYLQPMAKLF